MPYYIDVGARLSPLSKAQLVEVEHELCTFHSAIRFRPLYVMTTGDLDKKTSLRTMGKSDFFTKEIDSMLLSHQCRIGIHSAKDLPEPLPKGIVQVALTRGVNPSDVIVLREGENFDALPAGAKIATSSQRREECVRSLRSDLTFVDIRGNIGERLDLLSEGAVDGVVMAEAALIRLKLTRLNRFFLSGETEPMQGRLAVLAREDDEEMKELFRCIHA